MTPVHKRPRDDEYESLFNNKKARTLPFRALPTAKHSFLFSENFHHLPLPKGLRTSNINPTAAPQDLDRRNSGPVSSPSLSPLSHGSTVPAASLEIDSDMDMTDAQPSASATSGQAPDNSRLASARCIPDCYAHPTARTPPRVSPDAVHGGRVATPRWTNFRFTDTSMDMQNEIEEDMSSDHSPTSTEIDWSHRASSHRLRLPSPISEDRSTSSPISPGSSSLSVPACNSATTEQANADRGKLFPGIPTGSRKPPGSKWKISMGYRADCEKCRSHVPGHYNHVIRVS